MIFRDSSGYPVNRDQDGMDSSVRAGMLTICHPSGETAHIEDYVQPWGLCVRHPTGYPESNKWNFTKDQLKPLVAGLYAIGRHDLIRKIFYAHLIRFMFCQDIQRDVTGSWKFPWPHTAQDWSKDQGRLYFKGPQEFRLFDCSEPLLPDDWWFLIKAGKMYPLYALVILGIPWWVTALYFHTKSNNSEENQMIAMISVFGNWSKQLYVKWNPNWRTKSLVYWLSRGEIEYHQELEKWMDTK